MKDLIHAILFVPAPVKQVSTCDEFKHLKGTGKMELRPIPILVNKAYQTSKHPYIDLFIPVHLEKNLRRSKLQGADLSRVHRPIFLS